MITRSVSVIFFFLSFFLLVITYCGDSKHFANMTQSMAWKAKFFFASFGPHCARVFLISHFFSVWIPFSLSFSLFVSHFSSFFFLHLMVCLRKQMRNAIKSRSTFFIVVVLFLVCIGAAAQHIQCYISNR